MPVRQQTEGKEEGPRLAGARSLDDVGAGRFWALDERSPDVVPVAEVGVDLMVCMAWQGCVCVVAVRYPERLT